jgi:intraflagellar transport protein 57
VNDHSGSMTDNSPVVKIKESLINILAEIKSMDVRMGVLSHTILQYKTKEKSGDRKAMKNI